MALVSTRELAEETRLSEATIRALAQSGLPHTVVAGKYVYPLEKALRWLEDHGGDDEDGGAEE